MSAGSVHGVRWAADDYARPSLVRQEPVVPLGPTDRLVLVAPDPSGPTPAAALADASTRDLRVGVVVSGAEGADAARDAGLVVAVRADDPDASGFALAHRDGFGAAIEALAPDLTVVDLQWNTHDDPDMKKSVALDLTRLAAWLHETDRRLLVVLDVPAASDDLERLGGDVDRYERERRPDRIRQVVQELRDIGIEPDLWALPAPRDEADAVATADVARDAGRDHVRLLVRAGDDRGTDGVAPTVAVDGWSGALIGAGGDPAERVRAVSDVLTHGSAPGPSGP